jgi:hypothetical protein
VVNLSDETPRKEFLDLLPNGLALVVVKTAQLLLDWLGTRLNIELMFGASLGMPSISDSFHAKTPRFAFKKNMSTSSCSSSSVEPMWRVRPSSDTSIP